MREAIQNKTFLITLTENKKSCKMFSTPKRKKAAKEANTPVQTPVREAREQLAGAETPVPSGKDAAYYKKEVKKEKAGKRKLYLSLVKLAEELKKLRSESAPLEERAQYRNQTWYEGGLWRAPQVLPEVQRNVSDYQRARPREAISLSDMFLNLVIVTGFTRVGLAITSVGRLMAIRVNVANSLMLTSTSTSGKENLSEVVTLY